MVEIKKYLKSFWEQPHTKLHKENFKTLNQLCTLKAFLLYVCTKCYTSALCRNSLEKKYQLLSGETKEGFHKKSRMGKGGIQRSWWNIQCFMSKATAGKEAGWCADDGRAGWEERNQVRRHFAGRYHCETELGFDTRQHWRSAQVGRCEAKPAGSHSCGSTRYVIRVSGRTNRVTQILLMQ